MSNTDHIDDNVERDSTATPNPEVDQVVITVPAKFKRALINFVAFFRSMFTGEIVLNPTISKGYDYLFYMAVLFLLSILALFSSLHMQIRENRATERVKLLQEQAIRSEEQRLKVTTHSAIVNELKRRGIELYDTLEPVTVVKKTQKRR